MRLDESLLEGILFGHINIGWRSHLALVGLLDVGILALNVGVLGE